MRVGRLVLLLLLLLGRLALVGATLAGDHCALLSSGAAILVVDLCPSPSSAAAAAGAVLRSRRMPGGGAVRIVCGRATLQPRVPSGGSYATQALVRKSARQALSLTALYRSRAAVHPVRSGIAQGI
jgi:hypothetical protein